MADHARLPAPDGVRALPVEASPARRQEWVHDRFWFIPALLVLAGVLTAAVVCRPEWFGLAPDWDLGRTVRVETAETVLQIMASSMLTFVGVVFAITLVGLQLASSQLSPRVLRTFIRSGVTKVSFGIFLATFAFAITGLAFDDVKDPPTASRTLATSVAMLAVAVIAFIVFVASTMRLLEVGWVITSVTHETQVAIRAAYPPASEYVEARPAQLSEEPHLVRRGLDDHRHVRGAIGTVEGLDRVRLVRLASRSDCVIEVRPRIGEYLAPGRVVLVVHGPLPCPEEELLECVDLGRSRALYQDPTFGLRQLVDVATQSLSPAINQPTTAVQAIDRLQDLLVRISRAPRPTGLHVDAHGQVRLVESVPTPAYLLDLSFQEISQLGAASWHVTRRLAAAYDDLAAEAPEDWQPPLAQLRASLTELSTARAYGTGTTATEPDRLGLG
ncbi:MAG: DUF2254 domain-containing protein [Marmoricola sp.]